MKNGAQILLDCLKQEGVDTLFGYPGGRSLLVHDALMYDQDIRYILVRHEQGAAEPASRRGYQEKPTLNLKRIKRAAEMINQAKKPSIYAGGGITLSNSSDKLSALAEKGQLPVTHTLMGEFYGEQPA